MSKRRSRRLRKKLYLGEFKELGFAVEITFREPMDSGADETFVTAFLLELIVPRRLAYAGWSDGGFVIRHGRGSVSEADRTAVLDWLGQRPEVAEVEATPLKDVWYEFGPSRAA